MRIQQVCHDHRMRMVAVHFDGQAMFRSFENVRYQPAPEAMVVGDPDERQYICQAGRWHELRKD